jgi:hypothetical protein
MSRSRNPLGLPLPTGQPLIDRGDLLDSLPKKKVEPTPEAFMDASLFTSSVAPQVEETTQTRRVTFHLRYAAADDVVNAQERLEAIQAHAELFEEEEGVSAIGFSNWAHARAPRKDGTWRFSVDVPRWQPSKATKKQSKKRLQPHHVPIATYLRVLFSTLEGVEVVAILAEAGDHLEC